MKLEKFYAADFQDLLAVIFSEKCLTDSKLTEEEVIENAYKVTPLGRVMNESE